MSIEDLKNLLALLGGATALYASTIYMLQSRHDGIDGHERQLQDQYLDIEKNNHGRWEKLPPHNFENDPSYLHAMNILDQLVIVRRRYNGALKSFIAVMVQLIVLIVAIATFSAPIIEKVSPDPKATLLLAAIIFLPGIYSLYQHVWYDLRLAFNTQQKSREWLNFHTDERDGKLKPRVNRNLRAWETPEKEPLR
jgi:hypothetical protein